MSLNVHMKFGRKKRYPHFIPAQISKSMPSLCMTFSRVVTYVVTTLNFLYLHMHNQTVNIIHNGNKSRGEHAQKELNSKWFSTLFVVKRNVIVRLPAIYVRVPTYFYF